MLSDKESLVTRKIRKTNVIHIGDENLVTLIFFVSYDSFPRLQWGNLA